MVEKHYHEPQTQIIRCFYIFLFKSSDNLSLFRTSDNLMSIMNTQPGVQNYIILSKIIKTSFYTDSTKELVLA